MVKYSSPISYVLWYLLMSWAMLNGGSPFRSFGRLVLAVRHQQKLPDAHRGQLSRWLEGKAFGNQEANRTSRSSFVLVILQARNLSTFCSLEDNSKPNQICFPRFSLKHNNPSPDCDCAWGCKRGRALKERKTLRIWSSATSLSSWQWHPPTMTGLGYSKLHPPELPRGNYRLGPIAIFPAHGQLMPIGSFDVLLPNSKT